MACRVLLFFCYSVKMQMNMGVVSPKSFKFVIPPCSAVVAARRLESFIRERKKS